LVFDQERLSFAFSKQTEVSDLVGRKLLQRKGTSILTFAFGVLARAYREGRFLLLDEFDLCPPAVLASLNSWVDTDTIEVESQKISKHPNFRIIATLNGGSASRAEYKPPPSGVLARFRVDKFDEISQDELQMIFIKKASVSQTNVIGKIHSEVQAKLTRT
jgi:midasin